jgi:DNA-binding transcriptional MerR regulator
MKEASFSVSEAAEQAGTSVSSVRRWIAEFAPHFSPSAKPEKYGFRYLSQKDLQVLQEIVRLKEENLSTSTINERLNNMVFQSSIVESPAQPQEVQLVKQTALAVVEAMKDIIGPLEARQNDLEDRLEHRLAALEQNQQATNERLQPIEAQHLRFDAVWLVVSAFIAGLIVGLSVWWFGG